MNENVKEKLLDCLSIVSDGENEKQYSDDDLKVLSVAKIVHDVSIIKGCAIFFTVMAVIEIVGTIILINSY